MLLKKEPIHKCVNKIKSLIEQNGMWYEYMEEQVFLYVHSPR